MFKHTPAARYALRDLILRKVWRAAGIAVENSLRKKEVDNQVSMC